MDNYCDFRYVTALNYYRECVCLRGLKKNITLRNMEQVENFIVLNQKDCYISKNIFFEKFFRTNMTKQLRVYSRTFSR